MNQTNEIKKEYLKSYRYHCNRYSELDAQINDILASCGGYSSISYDGMPRGSDTMDICDALVQKERTLKVLRQEREYHHRAFKAIQRSIARLKGKKTTQVIYDKYILGHNPYRIAKDMKISRRQVYRLEKDGLTQIMLQDLTTKWR